MSDGSQTNSYLLWHLVRLALTAAIIILPITIIYQGLAIFFWQMGRIACEMIVIKLSPTEYK